MSRLTQLRATIGGSGERETSESKLGNQLGYVKDELIFATGALVVNSMEPFIKRSVLRAIARIYDPSKL